MALAAAACTGGMHRRIPNQGAMSSADKEVAESRRVRQLEYKSKVIVCGNGGLGMNCSCSNLVFVKNGNIFRGGETIEATYLPVSTPINFPDLNGVKMELELKMYYKDPAAQMSYLVRHDKFQLGDGCTKHVVGGKKQEINYKFSFTIPPECPPSYEGTFGSLTYTLTRMEHQSGQDIHSFDSVPLIILSKLVPQWENHQLLIQPMFAHKSLSPFLFGGKIQISLNTDHHSYQPGHLLQFALNVKNGGGKGIKRMTLQLQQNVIFNCGAGIQIEKSLFPQENGPSVLGGCVENWSGTLNLNYKHLEASTGDKAFNQIRNANKMDLDLPSINYEYYLRVTFEMGGSLVSNIMEEFPIDIGTPLLEESECENREHLYNMSRSESWISRLDENERIPLGHGGNQHLSMMSLAPSLPDYEAATATDTHHSSSHQTSSGTHPPSYSCLQIECHSITVTNGVTEYI